MTLQEKILSLYHPERSMRSIARELGETVWAVREAYISLGLKSKWTKSYSKHSKDFLPLTEEHYEILYGSMLGDGHMNCFKGKARFQFNHGGNQRFYFDHKYELFKEFMGKPCYEDRYDKRTDKWYHKYCVRSYNHVVLYSLYKEFYPEGKKIVPNFMLNKLTAKSIAYWFMDDGTKGGIIATMSFSVEDLQKLIKMFKDRFDIDFKIQKDLCIKPVNKVNKDKFINLIKPFILEEFSYKLG